jgi:uncharacterized tellurite resistance protein B-like protein
MERLRLKFGKQLVSRTETDQFQLQVCRRQFLEHLQLTGSGTAMVGWAKILLSYLAGDAGPRAEVNDDDRRLATAALLTRIATVNSELSDVRREALRRMLRSRFALDDHAAARLLEEAIAINREAIDLYRFTRQLNGILDDEGRSQLVQMMWEVVYADGPANEYDKNIIWRAADLLGVSSRRRVELRQIVAANGAAFSSP